MRRVYLGVGDKAGEAVITEGLPSVTCSNPPPRVHIATLYMKTWCDACKQDGYIAPKGPRHPGTGPNGQQWALSGDINICGCSPPPVFHAERNMAMIFTRKEVGALAGRAVTAESMGVTSTKNYDEQVCAVGDRSALSNYPYFIEMSAGAVHSGRIDSHGLLPRVFTDDTENYTVYWGDEALAMQAEYSVHEGWK
ncbi:MAG: hypothetical protein LBV73_13765 [Paraburkholderia sp.]|jgi:hypothetical protein|nr:hypothetical protein [Paraburkholderia sp.]